VKNALLIACLFTFGHLTLLAQTQAYPRMLHTRPKSAVRVPAQEVPAGLKKIYSSLGPRNNPYNGNDGWGISGPNSIAQRSSFVAVPFTPKSNAHVSQVNVPLAYNGSGANQVNINIYGDSNGVPGALLVGPITAFNLPDFGTCCTLVGAAFQSLAVTGGTQYWVVANTPLSGTGSDFFGIWDIGVKDLPLAFEDNSMWFAVNGYNLPAVEVLGTIP
jgi:hypothetical protein